MILAKDYFGELDLVSRFLVTVGREKVSQNFDLCGVLVLVLPALLATRVATVVVVVLSTLLE
jgi:hypothetical protein